MLNQRQVVPGEYTPYYFEIFLDTNSPLTELDKLPVEVQRAYYHEFWHYLQNITTTFGVLGTWQAYDRLRQLLGDLHQQNGVVTLPLYGAVPQEQQNIDAFLRLQAGSGRLPVDINPIVRNAYKISGVEVVSNQLMKTFFPGQNLGAVQLLIDHPISKGLRYNFGEVAISECMARMAEERHYGPVPGLEGYPYRVAEDLAAIQYPPVANDENSLFALCDVALMHPLPGYAFYHLLLEMRKDKFISSSGEAVTEYCLSKYKIWGWDISKQRDRALKGLHYVIDKLFHDPAYAVTTRWLKTIMVMGHNLRELDPYFALKLFRAKPFTSEMDNIWLQVGGPHTINKEWKRAIQLPAHLRAIPDFVEDIYPQRLRMVKQYSDLLSKGTVACNSYQICEHSLPPIVDQRCVVAPWERASELNRACPYTASSIIWGLHGREFVIDGQQVKF
jgi:hypothetical protein